MSRRTEAFVLVALLAAAAANATAADVYPSPQLLEFLGSFDTAAGEWLDPLDLPLLPSDAQPAACDSPCSDRDPDRNDYRDDPSTPDVEEELER